MTNDNTRIWLDTPQQRHTLANQSCTQVVVLPDGTYRPYQPRKGAHTSSAAKQFAREHGGRIINL